MARPPMRQPKPRPHLPAEHQLYPRAEAILNGMESKKELRAYGTKGEQMSKDTIIFSADPQRQPILVPHAAMIIHYQFGVPMDHESYPKLLKFNTAYDDTMCHAIYDAPIFWEHDESKSFRYIPGYTRYVIDLHGRILNAYNGKVIQPDNPFLVELVKDGAWNGLRKVNRKELIQLAFSALPEGFVDYGFGNYSHRVGVNPETNAIEWIPEPKVIIRNNDNGGQQTYHDLHEGGKCETKDFDLTKEFQNLARDENFVGVQPVGNFQVKTARKPVPDLPVVNLQENAKYQTSDGFDDVDTNDGRNNEPSFDDMPGDNDINFDDIPL